MRYKILYGLNFSKFEADVQSWLDAGWKSLGGPIINVEEYTTFFKQGDTGQKATEWRFYQAVTKEGEDDHEIN